MTIEEVYCFYKVNKENHSEILKHLKRRIYHIGTIRLLLIAGMIGMLWMLRDKDWVVLIAVACICLFFFMLLVVYHTKLYDKRAFEEGLIRLYDNELKALDYDFRAFDGAPEQVDAQHAFSMDLDLFGEGSIFQSINRTVTQMGKEALIKRFLQPLVDKKEILMHQESIREMKELTDFRHHFFVTGEMACKEELDIKSLFLENNEKRLSDNQLVGVMIWFVPAIWAIIITGSFFQWIPGSFVLYYFIASFLISQLFSKNIQKVIASVTKTEKILKTYSKLMGQVECATFKSPLLLAAQSELATAGMPLLPSVAIKQLSRTIGALDQRLSVMGILLNLLYMRDTRQAMKLERWKQRYGGQLKAWFEALGLFDAFCSFGAFAFNHPDYQYPILKNSYFEMNGKALGHPLIHRDKCVRNDIHLPGSKFFMIVTGANMAGKSTFLRTVGVNFLLACMGLPVYAESLAVYPARLVTSLRTADSLIANESYFFAELKRLKMIIDRLNAGEQLLILLDEILKGTNSVDKQKGSIALIKQLINKNTCGIIATHDLLLGALSDTFPGHVQNKRFEADIQNDELTFTYRLRDGIAQNMNATFLMKKMGIFDNE